MRRRPTKRHDPRFRAFAESYGDVESCELEATPPEIIRRLLRDHVERYFDQAKLRALRLAEASERQILYEIAGKAAS